ncbi:metal-dependent hydrolase [Metabacillus litoralis]|uniref:Metal-dependent hydrolase n=1 Tax=Metabacillus litoralis TaxID=152268 RepID=A0A5C6W672_9BACI|nr:metal-dependent hydrolase [Metabacillus litoralis]TXC91321.1 metal-dependent hydrolase [Metabacillus litoralis]
MKGTTHAILGGVGGLVVSQALLTDPTQATILIGIGCVAGLVPDMDIDGKLSNRITFSHKLVRTIVQLIGCFLVFQGLFFEAKDEQIISVLIGISLFVLSTFIKQRHMLTVTGIGVFVAGASIEELWLTLLGIYILIASVVSHRSYTHSLIGLLYFAFIAYYLEEAYKIDGIFWTCMLGYSSHLIADMKLLPLNKRGVKLFLPFSKREI